MLKIGLLLLVPLLTILVMGMVRTEKGLEKLHLAGALLLIAVGLALVKDVVQQGPLSGLGGDLYVDALSVLLILNILIVGGFVSIYTIGYVRTELQTGELTFKRLRRYYGGFHLFLFSMLLVSVVNNLGFLWVAIELTTLVTALLVGFYRTQRAVEAAWKYLLIGSVGISFALLGIVFLYASGLGVLGSGHESLQWSKLYHHASQLDPTWLKVAFLFVLAGFGTKAGLVPLHFWLPDAHSEAPSPISALLSGVLLNTALYGIMRVFLIADLGLEGGAGQWLLGFGLLSILVAVPFILVQHDYKRMLAYSSVEHMGIITLGLGIGGPLGTYAALFHWLNHSLAKGMLFMIAGTIQQKYGSKMIYRVTGLLKVMPWTGSALLIGVLVIAGTPPFSVFVSKWMVMLAGFEAGQVWVTIAYIALVVLSFCGLVYYVGKMVFGPAPEKITSGELNHWSSVAQWIPLIGLIWFGLAVPSVLDELFWNVVSMVGGGE